ncbi:MAG: DUF4465 domain-containing protein [Bacteroidales bacterium]|jgi:uncharacterized lipoprotein YehR (DUF1307 family)|nr:DUF4465 domain-containing protein [Bacteroidales bacterium]
MKKLFLPFAILVATISITGCDENEHEQQPPQAVIENSSEVTSIAQGESVTLGANVISSLETTIEWMVNGQPVAGAIGKTFEFTGNQTGEHVITLNVTNKDGQVSDQTTITVYYQIDFEASSVLPYVATANSGSGVFDGGYIDEVSGLKMPASVNSEWGSWSGIAISQYNDMATEGYANQLSAYYKDGSSGFGGYDGSKTFTVSYSGQISFEDDATEGAFYHFWVTNSTYAALSMKNGDAFSKKFELGDWFKLIITAEDKDGNPTGTSVEFYLADFRTATSPGILTEWAQVDLTPLGSHVHTVKFDLQSSDTGEWGMNTPAYFCFDNIAFLK